MNQEAPKKEETSQPSHNSRSVVQYIMVMFIVAFLLMALSMLMHQRTTSQGIGELQHSFSAMQSFQDHQEQIIQLEEALNEAEARKDRLEATIDELEAQADDYKLENKAMEQLYILQQQYLNQEYEGCRATLQTMTTLELDKLLSTKEEYSVPSPADTFRAIQDAIDAMDGETVSRETQG